MFDSSKLLFMSLGSLVLNLVDGKSGISCFIWTAVWQLGSSSSSSFSFIKLAMVNAFFFGLSDSVKKSWVELGTGDDEVVVENGSTCG